MDAPILEVKHVNAWYAQPGLLGRKKRTPVLHDYFPQWMGAFLRRPENREVRFECSIENTEEGVRAAVRF